MIDLDELERYAKAIDAACVITSPYGVVAPSPMMEINPRAVLALIERIREAEGRLAKMCDLHMDERRRRMAAEEREGTSRVMSLDAPTDSGCTCQGLSFYSPACHPACPAAKAKP